MVGNNVALAPCSHKNNDREDSRGCPTCNGSGWVKVVMGTYSQPKPSEHGNSPNGSAKGCPACKGSGWAGLVD
jgi:hypothetical protein